ncbi:unnamed protein product, partial [marine sediment metagenome]
MRKNTMSTESSRSDTFSEAKKYGYATVEYTGIVIWSIIERSGAAIKDSTLGMVMPVARNVCKPFVTIKGKMTSISGDKAYVDEKIGQIVERIRTLEERLAFLEKHGVRLIERPDFAKKKKELDEERKELLNLIVQENKA